MLEKKSEVVRDASELAIDLKQMSETEKAMALAYIKGLSDGRLINGMQQLDKPA